MLELRLVLFLALVFHFATPSRVLATGSGPPTRNAGTVDVQDLKDHAKVFAISDVHGMYSALVPLLKGAGLIDDNLQWAGGTSLLLVVGDSIDKGPQSIEVLDLWISLSAQAQAAGGGLIHTLGNHEAEFLASPEDDSKAKAFLQELAAKGIPIKDLTTPRSARGRFLLSLPLAARVGRWIFCHAGLLPEFSSWDTFAEKARLVLQRGTYGEALLSGDDSILEAKGWWGAPETRDAVIARLPAFGATGVVFGHQPKALGVVGQSATTTDRRLIKIDNGMAPEAGSHAGSVLVFEDPGQMLVDAGSSLRVDTVLPNGTKQELKSVTQGQGRR